MMSKIIAHKDCKRTEVGESGIRGVYFYTKVYLSADPIVMLDGTIDFASSDWEGTQYIYAIQCYDCDGCVLEFTDEIELYKLDYALRNYPDDYNVEWIEVAD